MSFTNSGPSVSSVNPFIRTVQDFNPVPRVRPVALQVPEVPVVVAPPSVADVISAPVVPTVPVPAPLPVPIQVPEVPIVAAPIELPSVVESVSVPSEPSSWFSRFIAFVKKHSLIIGGSLLTFIVVVILLGAWKDTNDDEDD